MIDRSQFNAEDFLVDSTFQQYCAGTDKLCIEYWEKYIATHPQQAPTIAEAKRLYVILSGNKRPLNQQVETLANHIDPVVKTVKLRKLLWLKVAAAIVIIAGAAYLYMRPNTAALNKTTATAKVFTTCSGERKKITLPDGSTVLLNAKSSLAIKADFNDKNREVVLKGEAYFDVIHDKHKPFKVYTTDFNINVLGTAFNVKAYPDEISSEATLIRGLINMEALNGQGGIITLKPSQKVTVYRTLPVQEKAKTVKTATAHPEITINHYTLIKDSTIVETAWTQNRIEIYDQNFDDIKAVLEKWYNIQIKFKSPEVEKYRFTATFSHETLNQALEALQKVEYFKYEVKGNEVIISK